MMEKLKNNLFEIILTIMMIGAPVLGIPEKVKLTEQNIIRRDFLFIIGFLLIILLIKKRKELKFDKKDILLLTFFAIGIVSTVFSIRIKKSIFGQPNRHEGIIMIGIYILIYYSAKNFFKYYKKFVPIALSLASILTVLAIIQFYDVIPALKNWYSAYCANATLNNSNIFANFITIFVPMIFSIYILKGGKNTLFCNILLLAGMLVSLARSAYLAFGIYTLLIFIYILKNKNKEYLKRFAILSICFVILCGIVNYTSNNRIAKRGELMVQETYSMKNGITDKMGSSRIYYWKVVLMLISEKPLLGYGPDTIKYAIKNVHPDIFESFFYSTKGVIIEKAHNEWLQIAATMGIPAMLIYTAFIILVLKDSLKKFTTNKVSFVFSTIIIGYLAQAMFNISVIAVAPIFWLILGLSENEKFKTECLKELNKKDTV